MTTLLVKDGSITVMGFPLDPQRIGYLTLSMHKQKWTPFTVKPEVLTPLVLNPKLSISSVKPIQC